VNELWGRLLSALSLLPVVVPGYLIVDEYQHVLVEFISGNVLAFVLLCFFAWLFLYYFLKRSKAISEIIEEIFGSSKWAKEVTILVISIYGTAFGAYLLLAVVAPTVWFVVIILHLYLCIKMWELARRVRFQRLHSF
jgi:uncharacterized membrane protein